jgi:NAD(P)-dependent dehydrogenase (short-subunit alcohol dehydrogenase family)
MTAMQGKTIVLTGASDGIGRETALALGRMGASLHLVGRSRAKLQAVASEIGGLNVQCHTADLSSLTDIAGLADTLKARLGRIDVLVNNAGAMFQKRTLSADGFEMTFALNHLAYVALTVRVLPLLRAAGSGARIVNVASRAHEGQALDFDDLQGERRYNGLTAYGRSKLCNIYFTSWLASKLDPKAVTVNCLHPGFVASGFGARLTGPLKLVWRAVTPLFAIDPKRGAATSVYLATSPDVAGISGRYFASSREKQPSAAAQDRLARDRLMEITARMTGLSL